MLFKQLVILNTIILVLLTGVFVSYNLSSINQLIENEVYGMFQTTMDSGEAELNETFEDARDLALELCASGTIQNILKKSYEGALPEVEAISEAGEYAREVGRIFPAFHTEVVAVSQDSRLMRVNEESSELEAVAKTQQGWEEELLASEGSFIWDYYYNDFGSYVRVSHLVYDETSWPRILGAVSVRINSDYLRFKLNSIWLGASGTAYLLDKNKQLLFPFYGEQGLPIQKGNQQRVIKRDGEEIVYLYRQMDVNEYYLVGEVRNVETLKEMKDHRRMILLTAAGALGVAFLAAFAINYHISTPILQLAKTMKRMEHEELDVSLPIPKGAGEISVLYKNFNSMIQGRKELMERIYGATVREKEAELRSLQAQINPHFLYNTLDSIKWMAAKYEADDIEEVVIDLSQMLRYSLNKGLNILKVSEELIQIKSYLKIQQMRFSNNFETRYEIDPEALNCEVIKLLLQPLVENALLHGFDEAGEKGILIIEIRRNDQQLYFAVKNNGKKMDLKRVNQALLQPEEEKPTSYGIRNVNDRLVKFYGEESRLRFSIEGEYSIASFRIPVREGDENA